MMGVVGLQPTETTKGLIHVVQRPTTSHASAVEPGQLRRPYEPRNGGPLRVLIVDDDASITESVEMLLSLLGKEVRVVTSNSPLAALSLAEHHSFDFFILDFRMPEMDGIQLWHRLHQAMPTARAVMVTAETSPEMAPQARAAGIWHVLPKPFAPDDLTNLVAQAARFT